MPLRRVVLLLALCHGFVVASVRPSQAQTVPSPYRFIDTRQEGGAFAGANFVVGEGQYGIGPKPGPLAGVRYGITLGGPISLEGIVAYMDTKRDVKNPGELGELVTVGEADMRMLTADARIKFNFLGTRTWNRIAPFVLAGAGVTFDVTGDQAVDQLLLPDDRYDFGSSFSGLLGLGVRWFPGSRLSFRSDLTLQLWQQDVPDGYPSRELLFDAPDSEWIQAWGITLGAAYNF